VALGQRTDIIGGRPGANGKDAEPQSQTCLYLVRKPASANASRSELRGLTQNSATARRWTALLWGRENSACRGEWRREAGSQCAPNASMGKRARRTPTPQFVPAWPQG